MASVEVIERCIDRVDSVENSDLAGDAMGISALEFVIFRYRVVQIK